MTASALDRWAAIRHALTFAGLLYIAAVWLNLVPYALPRPDYGPMFDARGFWIAWHGGLYDIPWRQYEAYVYSPVFAQVLWPLTLIPWPVFAAAWTLASIGLLFWMRVPWMLAFPGVIDDILRGNVHTFMAAAIVLGFRYPGTWAFMWLTKVTPGIGVAWFAVRRQWRALAWSVGLAVAIAAVSFIFSGDLWRQWFDLLQSNAGVSARIQVVPLPLEVRLVLALLVVVAAARWNLAWALPIGVMLALPNVWTSSTALLAASASLWWTSRQAQPPGEQGSRSTATSSR